MVPNAKNCLFPKTPEEATRAVLEAGRAGLILAGGTTAALVKDPQITTLIDLTRMGCDKIEQIENEWRLGCNVRLSQVAKHVGLSGLWNGMFSHTAAAVGSQAIRNAVTLGGNLVQLFRWSDPPVALLAMDAKFDLVSPEGERTLSADTFFKKHPRQVLMPAELLTQIRIQVPQNPHAGCFMKFSRTAVDFAIVDLAVCLTFEANRIEKASIAVGGCRSVPFRVPEAETLLEGKLPSPALVSQVAQVVRERTQTASDVRTSKAYRERMVGVWTERAIARALAIYKENH